MRQDVKSGIAANNSTCSTSTVSAVKATRRRTKKFPYFIRDMRTSDLFTEEEEIYTVSFAAEVQKEFGGAWCDLEFRDVYRERHPLLALGVAIADCDAKYCQVKVRLHNIRIEKL